MPATIPQRGTGFHPSHGKAPYRTSHVGHRYRTHYGVYGLPIASKHQPGAQSLRTVRLHAPVTHRVDTVVMERSGAWPELPRPSPRAGETLADREVTYFDPELQEDGRTRLFRVEVTYFYLCTTATEETDNLPIGVCPWDAADAGSEFPAAAFTDRIAGG